MRLVGPVVALLILCVSAPAFAQDWIEYYSREDRFLVNFPGKPEVRAISYPTEYGVTVPARVHAYEDATGRYSVTVVDYTIVEKIHAERVKNCTGYPDTCTNRGPNELRGALDYAAWSFIRRDARVTYYAFGDSDRVEGLRIQLANPDRSRTFAAIYMHENRLYILEATVPAGAVPPALFQQNLGFLDKDGQRVRYGAIYSNAYPPPPRIPGGEGRPNGCE
jgi:hypothetical protein